MRLVPERSVISANRGEVAYIQLMATDQNEWLVPVADFPVSFSVKGEGELIAAGNGSPLIQGSLQDDTCNLFRGKALVVIRSNGKKGLITLSASGITEGIQAMTTITVE